MSHQLISKTKIQQSIHIIVFFKTRHTSTVPPPSTQNESDGVSLSVQEYRPDRSWWTNLDNKDGK
eukprot:15366765-Ditylum_brightwellii.AAC.1